MIISVVHTFRVVGVRVCREDTVRSRYRISTLVIRTDGHTNDFIMEVSQISFSVRYATYGIMRSSYTGHCLLSCVVLFTTATFGRGKSQSSCDYFTVPKNPNVTLTSVWTFKSTQNRTRPTQCKFARVARPIKCLPCIIF